MKVVLNSVFFTLTMGLFSCSNLAPKPEYRSLASAHPQEKNNIQSYIHNIALTYKNNLGYSSLISLVDKRTVNQKASKHLNIMGRGLSFNRLYQDQSIQRSLPDILCQSSYRNKPILKVEYYVTAFSSKWWWNEARKESKSCR